jgi:hypothetical protein
LTFDFELVKRKRKMRSQIGQMKLTSQHLKREKKEREKERKEKEKKSWET